MHSLMWLLLVPFAASLTAFVIPIVSKRNRKNLMLCMSLVPLLILIVGGQSWIGSQVSYKWIPVLSINFHLYVDSLSLVFLFLTSIIIPISLLSMRSYQVPFIRLFYGLILLLQGLLNGFFMARDLVVFTFFWEAMLLPLYFIITLGGGVERQKAAFKFLIYMIAGSALMVVAVLALYLSNSAATFNMDTLAKVAMAIPYAPLVCAIFLLAFAVKTPLFPFHAWLPETYYQAPLAGTLLLSAILSKAGIYGFIRIGQGFFPDYIKQWFPLLESLAIVGVFYGGLAAWGQKDFKKLIAYSSFSHVNFILAGVFILNESAQTGSILQAFNHGVTIAGLFLVAGWLQDRIGTTEIGTISGLAKYMPHLCWLTFIFILSNVALPGTNNFIGELLILFGVFTTSGWLGAVLGMTVVLSVIYMLHWMQNVYFHKSSPRENNWKDIGLREWLTAIPLVILILWIGIYPTQILEIIAPAAQKIISVALLEK